MMAGYRFNKEEYFKETKEVYSNYPTCLLYTSLRNKKENHNGNQCKK